MKQKIILSILGFILAIGGISIGYFGLAYQNSLKNGVKAPGQIIMAQSNGNSESLTVRFYPQGQVREFVTKIPSNLGVYHSGQSVTVVYDPNNPTHAEIADALNSATNSGRYVIAGIFVFLMGLIFFIIGIKGRPLSQQPAANGIINNGIN